MAPPINRIVIYSKKIPQMIAFYSDVFGFTAHQQEGDRIVELQPTSGGATLLLHPAGKGQKEGQVLMKLVFRRRRCRGVLPSGCGARLLVRTHSSGRWLRIRQRKGPVRQFGIRVEQGLCRQLVIGSVSRLFPDRAVPAAMEHQWCCLRASARLDHIDDEEDVVAGRNACVRRALERGYRSVDDGRIRDAAGEGHVLPAVFGRPREPV